MSDTLSTHSSDTAPATMGQKLKGLVVGAGGLGGAVIMLAVLMIAFSLISPNFLTVGNLLGNDAFMVPAGVYSLFMFTNGALFARYMSKRNKGPITPVGGEPV